MSVTIGADPELFLQDQNGKFISSIGLFGGTKAKPRPFAGIEGMAVQEDNVAVEYNIPPTDSGYVFSSVIETGLYEIEKEIRGRDLKLAIVPSAEFDADQLKSKAARTFGCDPDFNVWMLRDNPRPRSKNKALRSAGGHVHIGYKEDNIGLGRACDLFMGCPSIMFDPDQRRRELYGKPGSIRVKPYGIEYRTLSNFWIKTNKLSRMVFEQAQQAVEFVDRGGVIPDDDTKKIIRCIMTADNDILRELTKKYKLQY